MRKFRRNMYRPCIVLVTKYNIIISYTYSIAMSKWIEHLNKHYQDKKRSNPKYTFTQAMKDAAKTYKKSKKGGASASSVASLADTAAPVMGGSKKNRSRKSKKGGDAALESSETTDVVDESASPTGPTSPTGSEPVGEVMGGAKKNRSRKSRKGGNASPIVEGNVSERVMGHPSSAMITK
jgi:hypothetical protein